MKYGLHLLRTILISPEIAVTLVGVGLWWWCPPFCAWAQRFCTACELTYLVAPLGAMVLGCTPLAWKILFPGNNDKALAQWPGYAELRLTTIIGVVFVVAGAGTGSLGAVGRLEFPIGVAPLLLIIGYAVAGTALLTMLCAALRIRAVMLGGE